MGKQTLVGGLIEAAGGLAGSGVAFFSPSGELLAAANPGLFDGAGFPANVTAVYPESGRVVVIGNFTTPQTSMARILADGSNDATFAPVIGGGVSQVIPDGTGYIILGGFATVDGAPRDQIARLNADGSLDAAWNPTVPGAGTIYAAAAHAGGVVVVRGDTLSRITSAGAADGAFTNRVLTPGVTSGITVQPDGKIIVCGTFTAVDGGSPVLGIARFLASGADDPAWVGPTSDADWVDWAAQEVLRASDGTLYVRLLSGVYNRLKKLSGVDGSTIAWTHSGVDLWQKVTIAPNDDVLAWTSNGTTYRHLRRWDASGAAIAGWDSASGAEATAASQVANIIVLADGSALSGGSATSMAGVALSGVVRKRTDGSIDPEFQGGLTELTCNAVAQLPDGTIVVAGKFAGAGATRMNGVALVDEFGVVADWFSPALSMIGVASVPAVEAVALHGNRSYIAGYFSQVTSRGRSAEMRSLARLLPNGDPDRTFADPYIMINTVPGTARHMVIDADDKIIVCGGFNRVGPGAVANNCGHIARFLSSGVMDPGFTRTLLNAEAYCLTLQPDGKILVGGTFTTVDAVTIEGVGRLNADGTRDTSWLNPDINVSGTTRYVKKIALQADGKVLVAGNFTNVAAASSPGICRLNADGTRDLTFVSSVTGPVECVAVADDGSIFIGGGSAVAKMQPDGSPAVWSNPFGAGDLIRSITIEPDGTLLVAGTFNRDGYAGLARLLPSGAIDPTYPKAAFFALPRFGVPTAVARGDTPPMEMVLARESLSRFETRPGVFEFSVYGGIPPYTLQTRGRAPDGLAVSSLALEGTFTRSGRYVWDVVVQDALGAELTERMDRRVNPLELPYGALLFVASPARVRRVDWQGGGDTEIVSGGNNLVQTAARLRDGTIMVGGTFSQFGGKNPLHRVMRLNADGTRDIAWPGLPASNTILGTISCFEQQSTGKVLVGARTEFSTFTGSVIRLNTDGTTDATFALSGGPSPNPRIHAMRVLPDDRILFGGGGGGTDWQNPIVFRTSANGAIDTAFLSAFPGGASVTARFNTLSSGLWTNNESLNGTPTVPTNRAIWSVAVMVDGKIVVGGGFSNRRISSTTSAADRLDFVGADGGHATPGFRAFLTTPAHLNSVCVFRLFPNADGSVTAIGNFTMRGNRNLDTGLAVIAPDGSLLAAAEGGGTSAPILDFAARLPDGRFYATHSAVAGKAVRLFPDGVVDTSFVSPAHQVAAILPDDNGVSGFAADGLLRASVEGQAENPEPPAAPFVGDGALYLFGINQGSSVDTAVVREQVRLGMVPAPLPVCVSRERIAAGVAGAPLYEGTAAASDAIAFADDSAWQVFKLVQERVVLSDAGLPDFTAMVRVVEHLLLAGHASHLAEAVALVTDALVLRALDNAFQVGVAADRLLMSDNLASVYAQVAEIVERVLLGSGAAPSYTAMVVVRDELVLAGTGAPSELEAVAMIREAIAFAANLTIDNGEYVAWVLNTESKGLTRYTQYPFNSFAKIGGRYMGCSADGLHWLDGDTDNGDEIHARIRLGLAAMGTRRLKRVPDCFIGYTSSGVLLLKAIVTDEEGGLSAAIYRLRPRPAGNLRENLFKPGRGLKAVDWDFEIENVDGGDFELSSIEFRPLILDRRTRG